VVLVYFSRYWYTCQLTYPKFFSKIVINTSPTKGYIGISKLHIGSKTFRVRFDVIYCFTNLYAHNYNELFWHLGVRTKLRVIHKLILTRLLMIQLSSRVSLVFHVLSISLSLEFWNIMAVGRFMKQTRWVDVYLMGSRIEMSCFDECR